MWPWRCRPKFLTRRGLAITLPRGYLSGPRLLSETIPRPGDCCSQNQESWRRTNMAPFIWPGENASCGRIDFSTSEPSRHQSGRPRSPVADRAPPRWVRGGPLRLPRLRVRQGRFEGPHHERPYEPEATPGPRDSGGRTLAAAEHPGRRLLGGPGCGVELPADVAFRGGGDDDVGAVQPSHDDGESAPFDDCEDLPRMRDRHPGRPHRQGELLVPGGEGPPPHGPQLHAGPGPRLDGVHETARDHVASGTDSAVRPDQQHRPRLQHPLERLAPWTRLLLPDGGDGRTGRARPGALHVPEGTELLDPQDGEDHGELLRPRRHDVLVGEARRSCERREPTQPDRHGLYQPAVRHQTHEEFPRRLVLLRRRRDLDGPRREHPPGPAERDREPVLDCDAREGAPRPHVVEELQSAPDDR